MNSAYERLKAVIIALGYTSNEKFEDTVGLGHGFVSRITNRVSSKSLQAITRKFPQVNPSYIRDGNGGNVHLFTYKGKRKRKRKD